MKLTMRLEPQTSLDGGGPLEFVANGDGFEAGRDPALDWCLPDPTRFISSRHFEVTFRGGGFYITDCSTNGTYRLGETNRIQSPLRLYGGERFQVGEYIIEVTIGDGAPVTADPFGAPAAPPTGGADPWSVGGGTPPPMAVGELIPSQNHRPSFDDEFIQTGGALGGGTPTSASAAPPGVAPMGMPSAAPPPPPAAAPMAPVASSGDVASFIAAICQGAGIPPASLQGDPVQLGQELGRSLRIATEGVMALLAARAQAKTFVKSSSRTMMSYDANNPMKFLPDASQAIDAMFFNKRQGFTDGVGGFEDAMKDIQSHQAGIYAAIQPALAQLLDDISPEAIEKRSDKGIIGSKRAANWDKFVERWDAKTLHHENGMLDVFLAYFAEAYDKASNEGG